MRDPFAIKKRPKWHPARIAATLAMRMADWQARRKFADYQLPERSLADLPAIADFAQEHTAVTPLQVRHLLAGLNAVADLPGVIVEIGAYRGETTRLLANASDRQLFAVDPFIGYGGWQSDMERFQQSVDGYTNVTHIRATSGSAAAGWNSGPIAFAFIDAVHDYANTKFDFTTWSRFAQPGTIFALHDTDNPQFPGTRRAAFEAAQEWELFAHVPDLVMLRCRRS